MTTNTGFVIDSAVQPASTGRRPPRRFPTTVVLILAVVTGAALIVAGMAFAGSGASDMASTTTVGVSSIGVERIGFAISVETVMSAVDALTGF